jgi:hypothetical protein
MKITSKELTEIKKLLYKEKPNATCFGKTPNGYWLYDTVVDGKQIMFSIPVADMGEQQFNIVEPAQLLIRYIDEYHII